MASNNATDMKDLIGYSNYKKYLMNGKAIVYFFV